MARVAGAGRIPSVVQLQLEQPEPGFAIQLQAQSLELLQQCLLRRPQRWGDPANGIAANVLAALQASVAADTGCVEITACTAQARTIRQRAALRGVQALSPTPHAVH